MRVLLTNGKRTVDLIWLEHNGTDIYYGYVGLDQKGSYHATGKRHSKSGSGGFTKIDAHHPLSNFKGQLQLCAFGIPTKIIEAASATEYKGGKGDSVLWLDARTLPELVNVSLGLVEVGGYNAMLPVHTNPSTDLRSVHLITNTVPWIYVMIIG